MRPLARMREDAAAPALLSRMRAKFPTAAIAAFEFTGNRDQLGPGTARLTRFMTPGTFLLRHYR
jgi:phosphohistidine phosphatase SixA